MLESTLPSGAGGGGGGVVVLEVGTEASGVGSTFELLEHAAKITLTTKGASQATRLFIL